MLLNVRTTPPTRWVLVLALNAIVLPDVLAGCWHDQQVIKHARQLAEQLLPIVYRRMPEVLVCSGDTFAPNVAGVYEFPAHRIRMHQQWVGTHHGSENLIHELAHAAVWLQYGEEDRSANGHGYQWMRIMIALGRREEAERNAWIHAASGGREALRRALSEPYGAEDPDKGCNFPECRPRAAVQPPQELTTLDVAQLELRSMPACREVLVVPGGSHGRLGYTLRSSNVRTLKPLPQRVTRILGVRFIGSGQLELDVVPSPDGTNSLVCVG